MGTVVLKLDRAATCEMQRWIIYKKATTVPNALQARKAQIRENSEAARPSEKGCQRALWQKMGLKGKKLFN
ncbi:MAG: hypothetical protein ACRELF_07425 [Gemmataceae bacterium]